VAEEEELKEGNEEARLDQREDKIDYAKEVGRTDLGEGILFQEMQIVLDLDEKSSESK
jgi:hypothetical protein